MSSRKENERVKYIQEKCQTLLSGMLRDEDNKYCVDCDAKGPRWASFNLGVFLCIRCAGIHRNLGVHISRVKSVNLDSWTPDQVVSLQQMGNSRARAVYEAQLPDGFRRPQTDSALESFIRAKYEHKKYMAREWVPPPPPKANWDKEVDDELERQKRKKKSTISTNLGLSVTNNDKKITSPNTAKIPIPAPLPKPKVISGSPKSSNRHNQQQNANKTTDLLNLDNVSPADNRINSGDDIFSNFLSASVTTTAINTITTQNATQQLDNEHISATVGTTISVTTNNENLLEKQEQDFFNQVPTESEKLKLTKDSIMALYDTVPSGINTFNSSSATTNAMYVPQQMSNYGGIPQQQYINNNNNNSNNNSSQLIGLNNNHQQQNFGTISLSHNQQLIGNSFPPPIQTYSVGSLSTQPFVQSGIQLQTQQQLPNNTGNNSQSNNINQQFGNLNIGNVWQ